MSYSQMTRGEKMAHVRRVIEPYRKYCNRGYAFDVLKILKNRAILNPETGKSFTLDQIRHTKSGRLPHPELADVIAEVGRRNKEALERNGTSLVVPLI